MKKLLFCLMVSFITLIKCFCSDITYVVNKNSNYSNGDSLYNKQIQKNTLFLWNTDGQYFISYDYYSDSIEFLIEHTQNGNEMWMKGFDLDLKDSAKLFTSDYYFYLPVYYLDVLKKKDRNLIYSNQPEWNHFKNTYRSNLGESFEESFIPEQLALYNTFVYFGSENKYLIEKSDTSEDSFKLVLNRKQFDFWGDSNQFEYKQPYPQTYMNHKDEDEITLFLKFDGDFVDIWINSKDEYMGKYFAAPKKNTQAQVRELIKSGTCDLSKVYWPRHADGTSDFDKEITSPMVKLTVNFVTDKAVASESKPAVVPTGSTTEVTTSVSVKKLMTTNCNLKLRAAEATSSNVLTVMAQGTKVKILELGKAETIDGIKSNWVKVEVQKGAVDRDGKAIAKGLVGWAYGGYLE